MSSDGEKRRVTRSEDVADIQCPMSVELVLVTSSKISDMPILEKVLELAIEDVRARFAKDSYKLHILSGRVRPMTKEELIEVIPRRIHLLKDGQQACRTVHVSRKNLTSDRSKVTCKLCLETMEDDAPDPR